MFKFLKSFFSKKSETLAEASFEDYGYRPYGADYEKGVSQLSRNTQQQVVFNLYLKNGFAKRLIQLPIEFIIGASLFTPEFKSKDNSIDQSKLDDCSDLIKEFNEKNKFESKFEKFALDLSLNGMLLLPVNAASEYFNGDVRIGFIDPRNIDKVLTDPYDVTDISQVKMKSGFVKQAKVFNIIRKQSPFAENQIDYDLLSGDAFYCAVNNVSNQPEGISDLLADIDMIHKVYELIINVVDSTQLANMFVMDVEIQGADAAAIKKWKKENPIPRKPIRTIHNEKVKQNIAGPGIKPFNAPEVIRIVKNFVLGNYSFPPMWFADGQDANRAIAIEQGTPVYKKLSKRQEILVDLIKDIYTFQIHQAIKYKTGFSLTAEEANSLILEIKAPEIQIKNLDKISMALEKVTGSLDKAMSNKWLTGKTIRKVFMSIVNLLGMDIDIETEESALESEPDPQPQPNIMNLNNPGNNNNNNSADNNNSTNNSEDNSKVA